MRDHPQVLSVMAGEGSTSIQCESKLLLDVSQHKNITRLMTNSPWHSFDTVDFAEC